MSRRRTLVLTGFALAVSLLLARVHPFGDAGLYAAAVPQSATRVSASIPSEARAVLIAKCADCHSAQTNTPIYGHFAPISWLLERDILRGRRHMNLSRWDGYTEDQQQTLQAEIVREVRTHAMPLPQYRMIHWNAAVTSADLQTLTQWVHPADAVDSSAQATTEGDPIRGKALFEKRCTGCHALTQNHEGPRLEGVYGRPSGAVAGFAYSDALKKAGITWNDQTLERWLTDPDAFLPGNNMDFLVARPQERKDLIAYFKQSKSN